MKRTPYGPARLGFTGQGRATSPTTAPSRRASSISPAAAGFCYSALSRFSPQDTMAFFEGQGVPLKTERGNRVFPCSDKALDIVDALVRYARGGRLPLPPGTRRVPAGGGRRLHRRRPGGWHGAGRLRGHPVYRWPVLPRHRFDRRRLPPRAAGGAYDCPAPAFAGAAAAEDSFCADQHGAVLKNCAHRAVDNRTRQGGGAGIWRNAVHPFRPVRPP